MNDTALHVFSFVLQATVFAAASLKRQSCRAPSYYRGPQGGGNCELIQSQRSLQTVREEIDTGESKANSAQFL